MFESTKAHTIYNLYKTKEHMEEVLVEEINNVFSLLLDNLERYRIIKVHESRVRIGMVLKEDFDYSTNDERKQIIVLYHIFLLMIGILDARYDQNRGNVVELIRLRKNIINEFHEFKNTNIQEIEDAMRCIPMHPQFPILLEKMKIVRSGYNIYGEAMQAYIKGYSISLTLPLEDIIQKYHLIVGEMQKIKEQNNKDIETVKKLMKNRK